MATFNDLPNELIDNIISRLSYRDRARMACVNKMCFENADGEASYKTQYIRDFGHPAQEVDNDCMWCHASAGSGLEPPHHWISYRKGEMQSRGQESSWKRAYIRRHNPEFPHDSYTSLPPVPYNNQHWNIEHENRLKAGHNLTHATVSAFSTFSYLEYMRGLRKQSLFCRPKLHFDAKRDGVSSRVEKELALRGWVLCWGSLDFFDKKDFDLDESSPYCCRIHGLARTTLGDISDMNYGRQIDLLRADVVTRTSMAQVPIEFETSLVGPENMTSPNDKEVLATKVRTGGEGQAKLLIGGRSADSVITIVRCGHGDF
ncbi:hypothetical protein IMSHALPRED_004415 [Imshaugia aleurites]|uniref:F-box domain-containing protein n=1 Tax=Imshaugia aleurites TaxID=172621 RepID=A0A8H3IHD8_9LECA|nr:hypothetical protein IMSHALPRED_004415 [Imshaugia aleurites]